MQNTRNFYINGQWVPPHQANDFEVIDPSTAKPFATISLGGQADTDAAVVAAKSAFASWSQTTKAERIELLESILSVYQRRSDEMGAAISQEMGAPIDMAIQSQAESGSYHLEDFLHALKDFTFESFLQVGGDTTKIIKEPIGVCALITPWNWPMNQIVLKAIPALATGCTCILKPSEISPMSALLFSEIMHEAGVPAGVYNMLNGDGVGVGSQLSAHPDVDMVSFTGSTRAGRAISIAAAENIKRVSLELGGKGANIVFADAGPKAVIQGVRHCFNNTGQSCNAPTRMLVERARYEQAVEEATAIAQSAQVNMASESGRHIGPLVSELQFNKVQGLIQQGIDEGARLVAGGVGRPEGLSDGYFVRPTIFADCNNQMHIMREEVFGPVLTMMPFDTEAEAIAIANDTNYGLTNYVQTTDPERAKRITRALRSGMVCMNGQGPGHASPFGGMKQSGNGREGGKWGLDEFVEVKAIGGWPA